MLSCFVWTHGLYVCSLAAVSFSLVWAHGLSCLTLYHVLACLLSNTDHLVIWLLVYLPHLSSLGTWLVCSIFIDSLCLQFSVRSALCVPLLSSPACHILPPLAVLHILHILTLHPWVLTSPHPLPQPWQATWQTSCVLLHLIKNYWWEITELMPVLRLVSFYKLILYVTFMFNLSSVS